jgi:hypothetical protein
MACLVTWGIRENTVFQLNTYIHSEIMTSEQYLENASVQRRMQCGTHCY